MDSPDHTWRHEILAGGNLAVSPVVFARDSKYFFCCASRNVEIYSLSTGQRVRTLGGHTDIVTAVALNPKNILQLYSTSLDGSIILWDFNDEEVLERWNVGMPLMNLLISPSGIHVVPKGDHASILTLDISNKTVETEIALKSENPYRDAALSPSGKLLGLVAGNDLLVLDFESGTQRTYTHKRPLTRIAFHPTESYVATGDKDGIIISWYLSSETDALAVDPTTSIMHWHSHGVKSLTFTDDGAHMLSGGEEGVLVIWQLHTGNRQYLPRLQAPLLGIRVSPDSTLYALSLGNNSIRLFSALSLRPAQSVHGLHWIAQSGQRRSPMIVDKDTLIMSGCPHTLQYFNMTERAHINEIEVAIRPDVSRGDTEKPITPSRVVLAAKSNDGQWMATVDKSGYSNMYRLQFWRENDDSYSVHTRVDSPHNGAVNSLIFHPTDNIAMTCGDDGHFKSWVLEIIETNEPPRDGTSGTTTIHQWECGGAGTWADKPAKSCAFSHDASMLAVSYADSITIWDPMTNALLKTLRDVECSDCIHTVSFIQGSPLLIAASNSRISTWNLMTGAVWWGSNLPIEIVAVEHSRIAVSFVVQDRHCIMVMDADTSIPLGLWRVDDAIDGMIWTSGSLVYLTSSTLYRASLSDGPTVTEKMELEPESSGYLDAAFGSPAVQSKPVKASKRHGRLPAIFNVSTHVLPDAQALLREFMSLVLDPPHKADIQAEPVDTALDVNTTRPIMEEDVEVTPAVSEDIVSDFVEFFRYVSPGNIPRGTYNIVVSLSLLPISM